MKQWFMFLLCTSFLHAHTLMLQTNDEGDGKLLIKGVFSTGETAAGALVKLKTLHDGQIVFEQRLPTLGELIAPIPSAPYEIILDGGSGHTVTRQGIAPPEGFKEVFHTTPAQSTAACSAVALLWALSGFLLVITIAFATYHLVRLRYRSNAP